MCIRQRNVTPLLFNDEDLLLLQQVTPLDTLTATTHTVLEMIVCGDLLGEELLDWLLERQQQGVDMPSLSDILELLLDENDPGCSWALPTAQGAALLHLTIHDEDSQLEMLESIQRYCCEEGFPMAASGDYLIQEMFRSVFAWGLVSPRVVRKWKADREGPSSKYCKTIALQQTQHFCRIVAHLFTNDQEMSSFLSSILEEQDDDDDDCSEYDDESEVEDEVEQRTGMRFVQDDFLDSLRIPRNMTFSLDEEEDEESIQDIESAECLLSMDDSMTFHRVRLLSEQSS